MLKLLSLNLIDARISTFQKVYKKNPNRRVSAELVILIILLLLKASWALETMPRTKASRNVHKGKRVRDNSAELEEILRDFEIEGKQNLNFKFF